MRTPPVTSDTDSRARLALESHLHSDEAYGDTPDAQAAARAVLAVCDWGDAVAATQLGTTARRLVVLVQYDDDDEHGLIDMDYDERREDVEEMIAAIEAAVPATVQQEVVIAIKGDWFYGAMGTRRVGEAPRLEAEELLDTDQLERMLSTPPDAVPPTPPALAPTPTPTPASPLAQPPPT